jgi:predicted Zn-dependent protease
MKLGLPPNASATRRPIRLRTFGSPFFLLALLSTPVALHAQLPAGTSDASEPQPQRQNPARTEANAALDRQDYASALKLLTGLAEKNPTDAHLLYDLGFSQDALNQTAAADATYRRAIAADAKYFEPHLALGLLLARSGKLPEARTELALATTFATDNQPLKARAYRALARIDRISNPSQASDELLSAIKISSETAEDVLLSGELAEAAGDPAGAEAAYRRLLAADPKDQDATAALTHLFLSQKKFDQAEALLTAALANDPDSSTLNVQLASLYDQQNKTAEALPLIEKLHAGHPDDVGLTRLLARLYSRSGRYDKSSALYDALVVAFPQDPTLLDDSADAKIHLKKFAEAEALLKRAIAQPSAFPSKDDLGLAASHLAFSASQNDDPTTTLQALDIRGTVLQQSPSSLFLEATAHDKLHHTKQARDLYQKFLSVANDQFPDEQWEARHRLLTLEHMK